MTPGCQLPPDAEDEDADVQGDGKGQQYNTPGKIVGLMGSDIVIVGRGIIKAGDPVKEAERYRKKAWEAYEERIA
jgi:uridine monophosphate synthetase